MIWRALQALALALFVAGSASLSVSFMMTTLAGMWWPIVYGFVALAVAVEVSKPVAVKAAFGSFGWRHVPAGIVGAVICVSASAYWELQTVSRGREAYALSVSGHRERAARLDARRGEITARLAEIGKARTAAELVPLIEATARLAGDCEPIRSATQREACKSLPGLKSEAARATEADRLRAELARMDDRIDDVKVEATAEARSIAAVFARAGVSIEPRTLDALLGPLMVLLLQLGAVSAAAIGTGSARVQVDMQRWRRRPAETPENTGRTLPGMPEATTVRINDVQVYNPHSGLHGPHALPHTPHTPAEDAVDTMAEDKARVLAVLTICGGEMEAGLRVLIEKFGLPNTHALRRVLNQLVSEKRIETSVSPKGTKVWLKTR